MSKVDWQAALRKEQERQAKESPEERARVLKALKELEDYPRINIDEDSSPAQVQAQLQRLMGKKQ